MSRVGVLWVWAARDLLRHPGESALAGLALGLLVATLATPLLLVQAVRDTGTLLVDAGPSLVVRRVGPGGWAPIPVDEAVDAASSVPGVTGARARTWGVAMAGERVVTLVGSDADTIAGYPPPGPGQALVGPGLVDVASPLVVLERELEVVGVLAGGAATHDLVVLDPDEAAALLGLPVGHASDLAVEVFHQQEEEAIRPDLVAAMPWPVQVVSRTEARGRYAGGLGRRGGLVALLVLPALVASLLLVVGLVRDRLGRRREVGLLKLSGWTTGDVVRLHLLRALCIGAPATALGLVVATALVFRPGASWPASVVLGWSPPSLLVSPGGALILGAEVVALVLVPWLIASLWPAFRGATRDPAELLAEGGP